MFELLKEKVKLSRLPSIYKEKLLYDLSQIEASGLEGLQSIILFGSGARNELRVGSDLDLLLISEETVLKEVRAELSSNLAEERKGVGTDIIFYSKKEYQESNCLLVRQIKAEGIVLWEKGGTNEA